MVHFLEPPRRSSGTFRALCDSLPASSYCRLQSAGCFTVTTSIVTSYPSHLSIDHSPLAQMASLIAARRAAVPKLLEKIFAHPGRSPVAARSLNTNAVRQFDDARHDDHDLDLQRRPDSSPSLQGVFDPFNPTRSLSQVLNLMDQMLDNPFFATAPRGAAGGLRRGWDAWEDEHALHLRVDMPGLGKEHVKVWAEQNTLIIKGEEEREPREENAGRRYSSRIDLPPDAYKMDEIRAEMKNGVLKVVVPKAKEEERKDVFHVSVE